MADKPQMPLLAASYQQLSAAEILGLSGDSLLALFEFGQPAPAGISDPRHVRVALKPLQQQPVCEIWETRGPVARGQWQDISYATGESTSFGQLALDEDHFESIARATQHAYEQILGFLGQHRHA